MAHPDKSNTVSAIVPACNEGPRIECVLSALSDSERTDEIIVVDDGSTDNTSDIARSFPKVKVIRNETNLGKHQSLLRGIRESTGDVLLFMDADIAGLTAEGVDHLAQPVLDDDADLTIAYRAGTSPWDRFVVWTEPCLCGERCVRRQQFFDVDGIEDIQGYELEVHLNKYFLDNHRRIRIVSIPNLRQCPKRDKLGPVKGFLGDVTMCIQIIRKAGLIETVRQVMRISVAFQLSRLRKRKPTTGENRNRR